MTMTLSMLAVVLLVLLIALCAAGLVSGQFDDNLLHCIGLSALVLWSVSEIRLVVLSGHVTGREIWLYASVAFFGCGTALRTWLYHRKQGCTV